MAAQWRFQHSNPELLRFVEEHTADRQEDLQAEQWPTQQQCRTADEMMKLHDRELRAMVIATVCPQTHEDKT